MSNASRTASDGLASVVDSHRVVVSVGSGGVGKTTTAAALGVHAAMAGKRVLCLTIDPAKRLANSLGLQEFSTEEQEIPESLFERHGLRCPGRLSAMMLDTKHTFDDLVEKYAPSPEKRDRILGNRMYQYVSTSLAGTQEYMAMEKLYAVRDDDRYDLVILDTPPTTNALDFLEAPERLIGAIDSPVMRWFVEAFEGKLSVVGRGTKFVLRGLSRFTGAEFLNHVAEFVGDLNELFGGFRERAQRVSESLRAEDVAFVVVTSPNALTVGEAIFFSRKLADYGVGRKGLVVNRVHPHVEQPDEDDTALAQRIQSLVPDADAPQDLVPSLRQALEDEQALARADRLGVDRLRRHFGEETTYVEVPAFRRDVYDLPALHYVAKHLMEHPETPRSSP